MKKRRRRWGSLFLAAALTIGMLPTAAVQAAGTAQTGTISNLALNKSARVGFAAPITGVSPENAGSPASRAVDGVHNNLVQYTTWNDAYEGVADALRPSVYFEVDLGAVHDISSIKMWRYYQDGRKYKNTMIVVSEDQTFDAQDPVIYSTVTDQKYAYGLNADLGNPDAEYAESASGKEFQTADPTEGRYVRVYMRGSTSTSNIYHPGNHLLEFEVLGAGSGDEPGTETASTTPLQNAEVYQALPTHYQDESSNKNTDGSLKHIGGQVTHPDVVRVDGGWNGYEYWMIYTPNVMLTSQYENPYIAASTDGSHWVEPAGITNPIEPEPVSKRYHNCDVDMVYNKEKNAMMAYWNWADDQAGGAGSEIRIRISYDGINWGVPSTYDETTGIWKTPANASERTLKATTTDANGLNNSYIRSVASNQRYSMLSPAFTYDENRKIFVMWANNTGDVGYSNGQNNYVDTRWSVDGIKWSDPVRVKNFLGRTTDGSQLAPWHQDIRYIPELKEYWALSQCFKGSSPDGSMLYLTTSKDGLNWQQIGTAPILAPGSSGKWDDFQIYRSSFLFENGKLRVWYSALQNNTGGKKVIDENGELTITATSQDTRVWRIGYTEKDYLSIMKGLTGNSSFTQPAMVTGTAISLSADKTELNKGEKIELRPSFTPANTSDRLVTYASSDENVVKVSPFGVVEAIGDGTAVITASTKDNIQTTLSLTVSEATVPSVNLALNKRVTVRKTADNSAATVSSSRPAAMAVDGKKNDSIFNYCDFGEDNLTDSQYMQIDLGQTSMVERINLYRYWDDARTYKGTVIALSGKSSFTDSVIVYNSDKDNFHGLGAGTDNTYVETANGKSISLSQKVQARFVRIYMHGSNRGNTNHIVEAEVIGYPTGTEEPVPAESVTLSARRISYQSGTTIKTGRKATLQAQVLPEESTEKVASYTSADESIATVDANGVVTGVGAGTVAITALTTGGASGTINITVLPKKEKGAIRHPISKDRPLYLENYYWSDDFANKNSVSGNVAQKDRVDSPVMLWNTVPDSLKNNTVILLIAERSLNNTDQIKQWIKDNVELCNANNIPCAVQAVNGETNMSNPIPIEFYEQLAEDNPMLVGYNGAELYNRFNGSAGEYMVDLIQIGVENGVQMMWTDTNIFGNNGVLVDWMQDIPDLTAVMRNNKEYIVMMYKESYGQPNTDALYLGMWLTEYCDNWGIASDWWHWQLDGNGALFDAGSGGDAWKQCLTWPESMYTQDILRAAANGATAFKSEAQWYSNATKGMRTPAYQYTIAPFLEKLASGVYKIPSKAEVAARTKAIIVGRGNWNDFNYNTTYSQLYPATAKYGIVPYVPANCPEDALSGFQTVIRSNLGKTGLKNALDQIYTADKSEGNAWLENYGDTWYFMNSSEDKNVVQNALFNPGVNGFDSVEITATPHTYGVIKKTDGNMNFSLGNYRLDKTELWTDSKYAGGFSDMDCYNYVWEMCARMADDSNHDKDLRDTVIKVKCAKEPTVTFGAATEFSRTYKYTSDWNEEEQLFTLTIQHNGIVDVDLAVNGETPADFTALQQALDAAGKLPHDENYYTTSSWSALQNAVVQGSAVLADQNSSADTVTNAVTAVYTAIDQLKQRGNAAVLSGIVDIYKNMDLSSYTDASAQAFTNALTHAQSLLPEDVAANTSMDDMVKAAQDLITASENLVFKTDRTNLQEAVNYADQLLLDESKYIPDGVAALKAVLETAKAMLSDDQATQQQIDAKTAEMVSALSGMLMAGDKSALQMLVTIYATLSETKYTPDSWSSFATALQAAQTVLQDVNAVQDQVDQAYQTLLSAQSALVRSADRAALNAAIAAAQSILQNSDSYTPSTIAQLTSALDSANAVAQDLNATQEQINTARQNLNTQLLNVRLRAVTTALQSAIKYARSLKASDFTKKSYQGLTSAIASGEAAVGDPETTQEAVNLLLGNLVKSISALAKSTSNTKTKTVEVNVPAPAPVVTVTPAVTNTTPVQSPAVQQSPAAATTAQTPVQTAGTNVPAAVVEDQPVPLQGNDSAETTTIQEENTPKASGAEEKGKVQKPETEKNKAATLSAKSPLSSGLLAVTAVLLLILISSVVIVLRIRRNRNEN